MAVDTTAIGNVYTSLLAKMLDKYDAMWDGNEIDAETYAKLVGQASTQLVQLSADLVQKQEQLDKDIEIKERSMLVQENESTDKLLTTEKQRTLLDKDLDIKTYENSILQVDSHNVNLKQIDSITKDIDVKERSTAIQESELADKLLTTTKQRTLLDTEEESKQYEVTNLLPEQLTKLQEEIDLLQSQDSLVQGQIQDTVFNRNLELYKTNLSVLADLYKAKQLDEISDNVVGKTELDDLYADVKTNRSI